MSDTKRAGQEEQKSSSGKRLRQTTLAESFSKRITPSPTADGIRDDRHTSEPDADIELSDRSSPTVSINESRVENCADSQSDDVSGISQDRSSESRDVEMTCRPSTSREANRATNGDGSSLSLENNLNSSSETASYSFGIPIAELKRNPSCDGGSHEMLDTDDASHTVLFHPCFRNGEAPRPFPDVYKDKWDKNHVRMPCSLENLYPVDDENGLRRLENRWSIIKKSLRKKITSSVHLQEAIMTYNTRYNDKWNFKGLHCFFTEVLDTGESEYFFTTLLPAMVNLALELPSVCTQSIPLLRRQRTHTITLSQKQIACLLANAFFCTFPRRNAQRRMSEYFTFPEINFNSLFFGTKSGINERVAEKLKCILHYFRRVIEKEPDGCVSFHRQCLKDFPDWENIDIPLSFLHITSSGTIEDKGIGMLQVDFANKFLGGGVLRRGCVQEEIRFVICPELIVSCLFTEMLDPNECLIIKGCEQFSNYVGYADNFKWAGNYEDKNPRNVCNRRFTEIVAIDATKFRILKDQYSPHWLKREINKAYCGFYSPHSTQDGLPAVATGNWGCGAFRGDPHLKSLLQLMAAAHAGRDVLYCTFRDALLCKQIHSMYEFLMEKKLRVGDIWKLLIQYHSSFQPGKKVKHTLYDFLRKVVLAYDESTDSEVEAEVQRERKIEERKQKAHDASQDLFDDEDDANLIQLYEATMQNC